MKPSITLLPRTSLSPRAAVEQGREARTHSCRADPGLQFRGGLLDLKPDLHADVLQQVQHELAAAALRVRLRSMSAMAREAAAWTIGTSASGTRSTVRRMAIRRTTLGSSYIASSIAAGEDSTMRARARRKTLAASVACAALFVGEAANGHRSRRTSRRGRPALLASVTWTRRKPAASNIEAIPTKANPTSTRRPSGSIG